jgi:hypothetical protein
LDLALRFTIITTCFTPLARAASPHFFQYVADADSSPSIIVDPWEKKCTGVNGGGAILRSEKSFAEERAEERAAGNSPTCRG